jgi:hypothetical protein
MYFIFRFGGWWLIKDFFNKENLIKVSFNKAIFDASNRAFKPWIAQWLLDGAS